MLLLMSTQAPIWVPKKTNKNTKTNKPNKKKSTNYKLDFLSCWSHDHLKPDYTWPKWDLIYCETTGGKYFEPGASTSNISSDNSCNKRYLDITTVVGCGRQWENETHKSGRFWQQADHADQI